MLYLYTMKKKTILTMDKCGRGIIAQTLRRLKSVSSVTLCKGAARVSDNDIFSSLMFIHTMSQEELENRIDKFNEKYFVCHDITFGNVI